jgi:hypothetical protein
MSPRTLRRLGQPRLWARSCSYSLGGSSSRGFCFMWLDARLMSHLCRLPTLPFVVLLGPVEQTGVVQAVLGAVASSTLPTVNCGAQCCSR